MKNRSLRSVALPIKRREMLGFMGGAAVVSLLGCQRTANSVASGVAAQPAETPDLPACVVSPEQTEGPYFVEEALNRSDIRTDPTDGSIKPGVPLQLVLQVSQVNASACQPLAGAIVDVWHCDAEGVYSDVVDRSFNTQGQRFLRGSQITDSDGRVEFMTIYPGWYRGRAVHIHFKIRNRPAQDSAQGYEFTSQLYFDDAVSDQVHTQVPYRRRGQRDMRNARDRIYQGGGEQLMLQLTSAETGYIGTFEIGLKTA
ncbi:MAG: intradiol ring-cleavage dioxygenase [Leptolyngbya sp. SIO4C1]|nr:intradiol ring-cleavage dioxygenase [Leptolyngbya sp. SIO4C1]